MKNMIRTAVLAVALIFATAQAQAQDFKPYVGVSLGGFSLDSGISGSDTVFGGFLQVGADFADYFGAELRVGTMQDATASFAGVSFDYGLDWFVSYLAKIQYPVVEGLRVYVLAGGTTAKATFSSAVPGLPISITASDTSTSFSIGGGVDYRVMDNILVGGEWVHYAEDVDGFVGTVKYEF